MRLPFLLCFLGSLLALVLGLHESDAGVVDWYKQYIGVPTYQAHATAPRFITSSEGKHLLVTATQSNVLAALNVEDGSIVWRYIFSAQDPIIGFHETANDTLVTLSGPGGAIARSFSLSTGLLQNEQRLHPSSSGVTIELGRPITSSSSDVYTLTNGHTLTRLSALTPLWSWSAPDQGSLTRYTHVLVSPDATALYAVGVSSGFASYTLHVTILDAATGNVQYDAEVPSSISDPSSDVHVFTTPNGEPYIIWLESSEVKALHLTPNANWSPTPIEKESVLSLVPTSDSSTPLVQTERGYFEMNISPDGLSLGEIVGGPDPTMSLSSPGSGIIAKSFYSTSTESYTLQYAPHTLTLPEPPAHLTVSKDARALVISPTGTLRLYAEDGRMAWTRDEGLANVQVAEFVELPERSSVGSDGEDFVAMLQRHAVLTKNLPRYLVSFVKRFVTGSYATPVTPTAQNDMYRDAFGFRQVLVLASRWGKVYGVDTSSGAVVWDLVLRDTPKKILTLQSVNDKEGGKAEVIVVSERSTRTVLSHLDALKGSLISQTEIRGKLVDSYLLDAEHKFVVLLVSSANNIQVHLYPDTPETRRAFGRVHGSVSVPLLSSQSTLKGYQFQDNAEISENPSLYSSWSFTPPTNEVIRRVVPPSAARGPVASLGRVLGNRTVLYKWLNGGVFSVLSDISDGEGGCSVYLVDGRKGSVVWSVRVPSWGGCEDVMTAYTENWFVYVWWDAKGKGWRVSSVEVYEGGGVDERTESSDMSSYDAKNLNVRVFEDTFVFPGGISAIGFTSTKFGMSARDLVVATKTGKIQTFPRRVLNPRRPHGKPTAEETEEGLFAYDPVVYDDPRRVISHNYDVANVDLLLSSPALLESTSLVLALGLDMFLTRVAPSGTFDVLSENFNKVQLVATVGALVAAIGVVRPMVGRKREKERWYY